MLWTRAWAVRDGHLTDRQRPGAGVLGGWESGSEMESGAKLESGDARSQDWNEKPKVRTRDLIRESHEHTKVRSKYLSLCPDEVLQIGFSL